jgi:Zn-dependent M28 family amino/carboxypeptidase
VIAFGGSHSTMERAIAISASSMNVALSPDPMPDQAIFVRSDHYALVKVGIPSVMLAPGVANDREGTMAKFLETHYHKPSDDLSLPIDWKASARFARLNQAVVKAIGDADVRVRWYEGDYFGETFAPGVPKVPKPSKAGSR